MADYSKYITDLEKYQGKLPDYIKTPGSNIMNIVRLYYDIMKEYRNTMIDFWKHFSTKTFLTEYISWKFGTIDRYVDNGDGTYSLNNSTGTYIRFGTDDYRHEDDVEVEYTADTEHPYYIYNGAAVDEEWKYTDLVEKICKTYDIIREHDVIIDSVTTSMILKNSHMIRLLQIKTMGVGFDGTREKLEELLEALFPKEISSYIYLLQTINNTGTAAEHATANVYLIKTLGDLSMDGVDEGLFLNGEYFLNLLGITLNFDVINRSTLIYDYTSYDNYDYDEGGEI